MKLFQIKAIGKAQNNQELAVEIEKQFIPALKHLSSFSHAILIYKEDSAMIFQESAKIISINEKTGLCKFERINSNPSVEIIDIKPYFPCEDRVINAIGKEIKEIRTTITVDLKICGSVKKHQGLTLLKMNDETYLRSLSEISHLKIFWWFDKFDKPAYRKVTVSEPPYEKAPKTGIFASRSPVRPNPIALTTARIVSIDFENCTIQTSMLDCFDNTPIIGISPYNPKFDRIDDFFVPQWVEHWPSFFIEEDGSNRSLACAGDSPLQKLKKYKKITEELSPKKMFQLENKLTARKQAITVTGARQNNLKNITVSIPHNKISVVTGVSGSGKSSLVFDTIYAESQFRFFESTHSVQHSGLKQTGRPEFDTIQGLTPAIAVSQTNVNRNPRSTFGTITGLYDLLRSLYAGIGIRHCPKCGEAIVPLSTDYICESIAECLEYNNLTIHPYGSGSEENLYSFTKTDMVNYSSLNEIIRNCIKIGKGALELTINKAET
ncbi:MAG: TrmO family methyltransferase, partial [Candidatus Cloacimonetes bacterium]|nr:TrmO family methyltransferase [Candidatus Cloacimonadota bacterium]